MSTTPSANGPAQTTHAASTNVSADQRVDEPNNAVPTLKDDNEAQINLSVAVDSLATDARSDGYCWLSLVPNELRRAARRRYPPFLDQRLANVLRDKLGPDTQLTFTVAHVDGLHFFHVRPGVGTTLAELCFLLDCDSFVGIDISIGGDELRHFLVDDEGASPSCSNNSVPSHGSFSLDNPPSNPPLPEYNNHPLETATPAEVWNTIITVVALLPPNDPFPINARELQYLRFRQLGGRKYDRQFADLIQGPGVVIMPSAPHQYFRVVRRPKSKSTEKTLVQTQIWKVI
ncbi:hypothetical protein CPB85DRAFT_1310008 [Mucidula mucida]|nr:hypothetical protein CPB85DRAFT_1310008 [Mucidula mucida]